MVRNRGHASNALVARSLQVDWMAIWVYMRRSTTCSNRGQKSKNRQLVPQEQDAACSSLAPILRFLPSSFTPALTPNNDQRVERGTRDGSDTVHAQRRHRGFNSGLRLCRSIHVEIPLEDALLEWIGRRRGLGDLLRGSRHIGNGLGTLMEGLSDTRVGKRAGCGGGRRASFGSGVE